MYDVQCTMYKGEKSLKSCDFSLFICIYAKKSVSLHANLDKYGFFFGIMPT